MKMVGFYYGYYTESEYVKADYSIYESLNNLL